MCLFPSVRRNQALQTATSFIPSSEITHLRVPGFCNFTFPLHYRWIIKIGSRKTQGLGSGSIPFWVHLLT